MATDLQRLASNSNKAAQYLDAQGIPALFKSILQEIMVAKPDNLIDFVIQQLKRPQVPHVWLLGPPTSKMRELCDALSSQLKVSAIKSSQVIYNAIDMRNVLGKQAQEYVEKNQMVPFEIMSRLLLPRLADPGVTDRGYILQGYPATKEQVYFLQTNGYFPSHCVVVDIPNDKLMKLMEKDAHGISKYRHYLDHQQSIMSAIHIPMHCVPYVDLADVKSVAKSIADEIKKQ